MNTRHRRIVVLAAALISLTVLAAPAWSGDFFGIHISSNGFGLSFGSSDWWVYGAAWSDPSWQVDYDTALTGYGEWVMVDGLGRVWRPWVAVDWRPYTYGRWVYTSLGWTWVAYEPWGYFPHHYGSWALSRLGWVWVPGYTYHAANVRWVHTAGYVGWYPCGPRGWSHAARGFDHGYSHGYHDGYDRGYGDGWQDARYATYVEWRHLGDADVARYAVGGGTVLGSGSRAAVRLSGEAPSRLEVSRHGGPPVPEARLEERTVRIGGRAVTVARPDGLGSTVERHARSTVDRALAPEARRHAERAPAATRREPAAVAPSGHVVRPSQPPTPPARLQAPTRQPETRSRDTLTAPRRSPVTEPSAGGGTGDRAPIGTSRVRPGNAPTDSRRSPVQAAPTGRSRTGSPSTLDRSPVRQAPRAARPTEATGRAPSATHGAERRQPVAGAAPAARSEARSAAKAAPPRLRSTSDDDSRSSQARGRAQRR